MEDTSIGFIGLGNMGNGMCLNLLRNSYQVTVHDVDKDAALPCLEMGVRFFLLQWSRRIVKRNQAHLHGSHSCSLCFNICARRLDVQQKGYRHMIPEYC